MVGYDKPGPNCDCRKALIILRGNSGSGKTSLAKALQRKFGRNTMVISQDVIRRDMLYVRDGPQSEAIPLLMALTRYGHEHSRITILEGILDSACYRPLFECAQALYGPHIRAYYYDLPFEETLRRHATKPNCHDFGEADMRRWWSARDYIGFIPEMRLTVDLTLADAAEQIYQEAFHAF